MTALMPEYRAQLYDAAERRARRPVARLGRLWPVAVSTAIVLAVVIAAVAVLSHGHAPSAPARPGPAVSFDRQLLDTFAVLRRPQTAADLRAPLPAFLRVSSSPACLGANSARLPCTLKVDPPLIRTVAVPGSRYEVGIFPVNVQSGAPPLRTLRDVAVTLDGPGVRGAAGTGPWGLTSIRTRGLVVSDYVSAGVNRGVFLVPDGVARVVIGPVHLLDPSISTRFAPTDGATAAVHDNVALFQLNGLTVQNLQLHVGKLGRFFREGSGRGCGITFAIYALPATATVTWFAADGQLVNHFRLTLGVYVGTHHPAPGTTTVNPGCAAR
ncbi:MAG: hypothetical protein JO027_08630 [Solirubrobacterales bacterium]|nr:hypothetical protein [Solirubrobacterales bacterium]